MEIISEINKNPHLLYCLTQIEILQNFCNQTFAYVSSGEYNYLQG